MGDLPPIRMVEVSRIFNCHIMKQLIPHKINTYLPGMRSTHKNFLHKRPKINTVHVAHKRQPTSIYRILPSQIITLSSVRKPSSDSVGASGRRGAESGINPEGCSSYSSEKRNHNSPLLELWKNLWTTMLQSSQNQDVNKTRWKMFEGKCMRIYENLSHKPLFILASSDLNVIYILVTV